MQPTFIYTISLLFLAFKLQFFSDDSKYSKETRMNSSGDVLCDPVGLHNIMQFRSRRNDFVGCPFSLVMLLIGLVTLLRSMFQFLLRPFGQQNFVSEMLGGIALSPSFLGQIETFRKGYLFSPKSMMVIDVFEALGFIFFIFLLSVKLDVTILRKCGKLEVVLGLASFVVPVALTIVMASFIREVFELDQNLHQTIRGMAVLLSTTSFHVVLSVLADMKLLNSEIGRLALSSSLISGISSWMLLVFIVHMEELSKGGLTRELLYAQMFKFFMVVIIVFVFRPIMFWMIKQTPEGKPLKESYICSISVMVLFCALFAEFTGQRFIFGPLVLGLATPDGPPVGSSLTDKMDCLVEMLLMPCYIIDVARRINVFRMTYQHVAAVGSLFFVSTLSKFAAILVPSLYYKMPFFDALALGLILNSKGFMDILVYSGAARSQALTDECFGILVITAMLQSGILTPLVRLAYDPSRRYIAYSRRTIQHSDAELRILACIHHQDNVPAIIRVLEASSPTRESPIAVYVMNLKEFIRATVPLFITHKLSKTLSAKKVDHVINAFCKFQQQNSPNVSLQCFTSYAPYPTMHDDVCTMALDRSTSLVIIPFQHFDGPSIQTVNRNIIEKAPCSVGILYDRGNLEKPFSSSRFMQVCVVFIGGLDDRETLAFAERMSAHPNIRFTVIRLVSLKQNATDLTERRLNANKINEFMLKNIDRKNTKYKEVRVKHGNDTVQVLGTICNDFELIMVGRRHNPDSFALLGLAEWSEIDQELGVIGDILASPDSECTASILVVQQQASVVEGMIYGRY